MKEPLAPHALEQLFLAARTYPTWTDRPVSDEQLAGLYELLRWGPTAQNCQPARLVALRTPEARERLVPALMGGNVKKVRQAPVTIIVAQDLRFHENLARLWPADPQAGQMFADNPQLSGQTAFRNSSLQGAYLILAARALGLDAGPMSGFDADKVNAEFFPDGRCTANFLVNLGHGDAQGLYPRGPRLSFEEAVTLL